MEGICNSVCSGAPLVNLAAIANPSSSNIVTIRNQDDPVPPKPGLLLIPQTTPDSSSSPKNPGRVLGHPTRDISEDYTFGRELGRGQFGVTFLVTHKATKQRFACKSIPTRKIVHDEDIEDIRREVQIMYHLTGHGNIVELKDTYEDEDSVYLVMELCEGGELFDRIIAKGHYSEKDAACLFRQIITVIHNCHTMGVMHRDLKPENFLFLSTDEASPLKATDFGLSVFLKPGDVFRNLVGSAYYVAPELLKRQYGAAADVWSAGVILYILLCGSPPFWAKNDKGIFREILKGNLEFTSATWQSISSSAKNLIKTMLKYNPNDRASVVEVLNHPWMRVDGEAPDVALDITVIERMKQFSAMNKFKKVALKVIAENLSEEEIMGMKEMFKLMDVDSSGTISFEELKSGIAKLGSVMSEADLRKLLEAADVDGDGTIDYSEFISATMHINRVDKEDRLFKAFEYFDKDKSGYICKDELADAMKKHTMDDVKWVEDILSEVDLNKDGKINYDEFVVMMKNGNSNL